MKLRKGFDLKNNFKKLLPAILSVVVFTGIFVYSSIKSRHTIVKNVQLAPENSLYKDKYGDGSAYGQSDITKNGIFTNTRVNKISGASEPCLAVNPKDNSRLAIASNDFSLDEDQARVFISGDAGGSWNEKTVALSGKIKKSSLSDPQIEYDLNGNIIFCGVQRSIKSPNAEAIFITVSSDGGYTWKTDMNFVDYNNIKTILIDKPKISTDRSGKFPQMIYCCWTEIKNFQKFIMFSKSGDGGISFSHPVKVESGDAECGALVSDTNGNLYVVYLKEENNICFKKSTDMGNNWISFTKSVSFTPPGIVREGQLLIKQSGKDGIRINSDPAVKLSGDELQISFCASNGKDASDIFFFKLNLRDSQLSAPVRVNTDNTGNDQFLPSIAVHNGKVFITYQDSRNDRNNIITEAFVSVSDDGGKTFTDQCISTASYNPVEVSVSKYFGDYNSSAVVNGKLLSVWTDGRNNNFDLYAGEFDLKAFTDKYHK